MTYPNSSMENPTWGSHRKNGRRIYVFALVTSVAFLIGCCFFNRHTGQRVSQASISLAVSPTANQSQVREVLINTVRQVTCDEQLLESINCVSKDCVVKNSSMKNTDAEQLRQQLRIISGSREPGVMNIAVSLVGLGTPDEIAFVNQITNQIASEIPKQGVRMALQRQKDKEPADSFSNVADSTSHELQSINDSVRSAQIKLENVKISFDEIRNGSNSNVAVNPAWKLLNGEIEELRAVKLRLMKQDNLTEQHPDVTYFQQQIEAKSVKLSGIKKMAQGKADQQADERRVNNRFFPVSSQTSSELTIDDVASELKTIDLTSLVNTTTQLQEKLNQHPRTEPEAITEYDINGDTPTMQSIKYADSSVSLKSENTTRYGWAMLISLVLGSVIAWQYKPALDVARFKSAIDVARNLNLPVLGTLNDAKPQKKMGAHAYSVGIIRAFEYMGIALIALVVLACLFSTDAFTTIVETPAYAFTRILWIIFG